MLDKISHNFRTALESLNQNKLRAFLTSLGIIFGVASVIAMMAIGRGAEESVIQQLADLGSHNIILNSIPPDELEASSNEDDGGRQVSKRFSPGLTLKDAESILKLVPGVTMVCPEVSKELNILFDGKKGKARTTGITNDFFSLSGFELDEGNQFTEEQERLSRPVCIIGSSLKGKLFAGSSPIGKSIKVGRNWFEIVGVAKSRSVDGSGKDMKLHDYKMEVFVPISTFLLRIEDRSRVSLEEQEGGFMFMMMGEEETTKPPAKNINQLDKITIVLEDNEQIIATASVIKRMILRRHNKNEDYAVVVPEMLLKQQQDTQATFGYVLIFIALISLLVGGIGIMNIMLASVMERIKEIGVRLALGATKADITIQFLSEAVTLSVVGGFIGIFVGVSGSLLLEHFSGVMMIITPSSIIIAFLVSMFVGVAFGYLPARRAATQDPVFSLRYE